MIQIDDLTDEQYRKLEELGFTVGLNTAYKVAASGRATLYVWYPSIVPGEPYEKFVAEVRSHPESLELTAFDDPISAAVFLLTCV